MHVRTDRQMQSLPPQNGNLLGLNNIIKNMQSVHCSENSTYFNKMCIHMVETPRIQVRQTSTVDNKLIATEKWI